MRKKKERIYLLNKAYFTSLVPDFRFVRSLNLHAGALLESLVTFVRSRFSHAVTVTSIAHFVSSKLLIVPRIVQP